jgi:hypothetical protein
MRFAGAIKSSHIERPTDLRHSGVILGGVFSIAHRLLYDRSWSGYFEIAHLGNAELFQNTMEVMERLKIAKL